MVIPTTPKPPPIPPVSSKAKDYSMERPSEVQNELDELRNRGLAKVLNRHFTATTKKLAKEKAAADAALADLERRRANTSEFVPSKGGELHPFDSLYVQLQQKRAECRRKERETMLLYQRYVHKYGRNTKIKAPAPNFSQTTTDEENDMLTEHSKTSSVLSTPENPPPPSPSPRSSGKPVLQPLDENSEAVVNLDVNFSKFYNKQISEAQQRANSNTNAKNLSVDGMTSNTQLKDESKDSIVPESQEVTPATSRESPSVVSLDEGMAPFVTTPRTKNEPIGEEPSARFLDDRQDEEVWSRQGRLDPPADPPADPLVVKEDLSSKNEETGSSGVINTEQSVMSEAPVEAEASEAVDKYDEEDLLPATVNGNNDALDQVKKDSESNLGRVDIDIPSIKGVPPPDGLEGGSDTSDSNRPTLEVTTEKIAETSRVQLDEDERSVISGLTMNSHVTKLVIDEIEQEMDHFLKTETEAIRKMLDEEERTMTSEMHRSSSSLGDETRRASMQAEKMAKEMQKILDQYAKEDVSVSMNGDESNADAQSTQTSEYPRKYETSNPSEDWRVYYDESFKREYYFEKVSGRTQWEAPAKDVDSISMSHADQQMRSEDVMPTPFKRQVSRRDLYRKKLRKRRLRRAVAFLGLVAVGGSTVLYWQSSHPEKSYSSAMTTSWESVKEQLADKLDIHVDFLFNAIKDDLEYRFTDRKVREEESAKRAAAAKVEQERALEVARKTAEEAERKRKEQRAAAEKAAADRAAAERMRAAAKAAKEAEEAARKIELKKQAEKEALMRARAQEEALRRPWACNLPLAYFHKRCGKLAILNPLYKEEDLIKSFLQ